ncbi:ATP-binding cassette domain-containing protein [Phytoactinopolyspora mesophila]|uniref:ATP-binding cassette domain-containing protein n=1 Tax=Phytoactinopolyspora mesophila TaxID=2650750 RepID=A0A7K3M8H7_9ACTN|nr:ATP-binding cassette domain-containing protein [Phytoactinopolyspora mesophila]NDL59584.1 ATP-binding cassette domain-containing protein [Phytoactinopolyspora mesophila]
MTQEQAAPAIEVTDLVKRFGETTAVDGIDLGVARGAVLGLLGPNGAGKTTVVRVLATLLRHDAGVARVCGYDVARDAHRVRQLIGVTGQYASIDEGLTGFQNLTMVGRLLGLSRAQAKSRAAELIENAGLDEAAAKPAKTYSGGMRRRLDLAASLVNRPAVVFLDEPTTGLDPARRGDTWDMVRELATHGSTVLLTTQYLEEADHLADEIVVLDSGKVAARGTPDTLKRRLGRQTLDVRVSDPVQLDEAATRIAQIVRADPIVDVQTSHLSAAVTDSPAMPAIVRSLDEAGIEISELALRLPSLDDVFLTLTGHRATTDDATPTVGVSQGDAS